MLEKYTLSNHQHWKIVPENEFHGTFQWCIFISNDDNHCTCEKMVDLAAVAQSSDKSQTGLTILSSDAGPYQKTRHSIKNIEPGRTPDNCGPVFFLLFLCPTFYLHTDFKLCSVKKLGHLALAIIQAGGYICKYGCSPTHYRNVQRTSRWDSWRISR
jgi:hypothetical protein